MELVPALATRDQQTGVFQNREVLRHRLPGRRQLMLHREARADLEERLLIALDELVDDHPACVVGDGLEDVTHVVIICK